MEFSNNSHLFGAFAALLSAFSWAISALLFAQISHSINALAINLVKGVVAIACLALLVMPIPVATISSQQWVYLGLSGILGIAIGDTLYFLTLKQLGARLTLLMSTLIPLVAAVGAVVIFSEKLSAMAVLGLGITLCSVFYVMWSRAERSNSDKNIPFGLILGVVFITTEASAILLTKAAVIELDSVLVTFLRQVIGVAGLTFWLLSTKQLTENVNQLFKEKKYYPRLLLASVIGGVVGTWLSIYALKVTHASVAVILNSTSPLFIIPLSIWVLREKVPKSSQIGAFIAVAGIIIYFLQLKG